MLLLLLLVPFFHAGSLVDSFVPDALSAWWVPALHLSAVLIGDNRGLLFERWGGQTIRVCITFEVQMNNQFPRTLTLQSYVFLATGP